MIFVIKLKMCEGCDQGYDVTWRTENEVKRSEKEIPCEARSKKAQGRNIIVSNAKYIPIELFENKICRTLHYPSMYSSVRPYVTLTVRAHTTVHLLILECWSSSTIYLA